MRSLYESITNWFGNTQQQQQAQVQKEEKLSIIKKIRDFDFEHDKCIDDFDQKGDIDFQHYVNRGGIQMRGGWPYFIPTKGIRYGLNVSGKYDNKKDNWLSMSGCQGQWAVAFYSVSRPDAKCPSNNITVLNSMMAGLSTGQMLKAGSGQAYGDDKCLNKPNQPVGVGVYCTPHIQVSIEYSQPVEVAATKQKYRLVMQCRVNPNKLKVTRRDDYWLVNQSKDIRPYGIILIKQQDARKYGDELSTYGEDKVFTWNTYKDKIKQI